MVQGTRWKQMDRKHKHQCRHAGIRALSKEETEHVEKSMQDHILTSRWLDSRWILQGFRDPDLLECQSVVPSLAGHGLLWALFVMASKGWETYAGDMNSSKQLETKQEWKESTGESETTKGFCTSTCAVLRPKLRVNLKFSYHAKSNSSGVDQIDLWATSRA
eukprot:6113356-Amphidinium_carterae.3